MQNFKEAAILKLKGLDIHDFDSFHSLHHPLSPSTMIEPVQNQLGSSQSFTAIADCFNPVDRSPITMRDTTEGGRGQHQVTNNRSMLGSCSALRYGRKSRRHARSRQLPSKRLSCVKSIRKLPEMAVRMSYPEGFCELFPPPPRTWQCCGCEEKFYNFERECTLCATNYCKHCKTIPWK